MKNQKGVSLITLIITIIVVIILAIIILRSGVSNTPDQASFSGFTKDMGELQDNVKLAMLSAKGDEAIRGNNRSEAQLYNFVARGGYKAMPATDAGDATWLIQADAEAIPCTLINKDNAEESIGMDLPVIKVETVYGTNQEVSFFVTPKGNVFCWPPYVYDGKSYVAANVTVKGNSTVTDGKAVMGTEEMADITATKEDAEITIVFPNGEYVLVDESASTDVAYERNDGQGSSAMTGVWYGDDVRTAPDYRGVAAGYEFSGYYNNSGDIN